MDELADIQIPDVVPVMTLRDTVLFPHAVMPLYIFEQRYRAMLRDVLGSHRLFAVFSERQDDTQEGQEEPPETMGTVGIVRASHQNPDGTSNLALQGICRVRLVDIVQESPYRLIQVVTCHDCVEQEEQLQPLRRRILRLLENNAHLTQGMPEEYLSFIQSLQLPGPFIDIAIHSFCPSAAAKQELLETLHLLPRFQRFIEFLTAECRRHDLFRLLQGRTRDEEIDRN